MRAGGCIGAEIAADCRIRSPEILVPTVLRSGPYRVFFYSGDGAEPPHVHVLRDDRVAKFWLSPVRLQRSGGLRRLELARVQRMIQENEAVLLEAWSDFFGD